MKRLIKIVAVLIAVVLLVLVALPFLINANTFRPALETQLTRALGRQVTLGDLRLSILSGSLAARDIQIADDARYSRTPFLHAQSLEIGVEMRPLIFDRKLQVRSLTVQSPQIHLVRAADGTWNFSTIAHNAGSNAQNTQSAAIPNLTLGLFSLRNGRAIVEGLPGVLQPLIYDHVDLTIRQSSLATSFPFQLSATLPGEGLLTLHGNAGPINQTDASNTAFDAALQLKHLNPVAGGLIPKDPSMTGFSMIADIDAHVVSNGATVTSNGTVHIASLQLAQGDAPFPKPVDVTYSILHNLQTDAGQIPDVLLQTGSIAVHLNGDYKITPATPLLNLKMAAQKLSIDALQAYFPAAGVNLPRGSVLQGGTLTANLRIVGAPTNLTITGPVQVDNSRLAGFNLRSKLSGIVGQAMGQTGDITELQTLSLNLTSTNQGIQTDKLYLLMPAVGEATGSGTVSKAGALNYQLNMKINKTIGRATVGVLSRLNAIAGRVAADTDSSGIPVNITGTSIDPIITVNVKSILKHNAPSLFGSENGQPGASKNPFSGLFKRPKQN